MREKDHTPRAALESCPLLSPSAGMGQELERRVAGPRAGVMMLLSLRDVSKRFSDGAGEVLVLDGVSLEVGVGEAVGVLASRRRAGKTTLLRIAAGLDVPDEGVVCWEGRDLAGMSGDERARVRRLGGIACARGSWAASESVSVEEYVTMSICGTGLRMGEAEAHAQRALDEVGVLNLGHNSVDRLGLSERLRVGLAHALAHQPRLLLMDEPAVLRGMSEADEFYALLHRIRRRRGFALLVVSDEIAALAGVDRVLNLANRQLHAGRARGKVLPFPGRPTGGQASATNAS